ncbi:MAG: cyclic-di-GMP receptor FimW [Gammaproteobacteria bacterium]|nr:MAG: cyclic-di-GMP receptor FimW [Gammaproteobacteria bacterium]
MQLSVPNRTAPKSGSFDSNPASVKKWIDALPMANIGQTTRLLFEALTDLNHQDITAQQRFKTLELLYRPVRYVTERMKKHFVGQPLPLPLNNLKVANLSREISHALATGYKVLVMEQIAGIGRKDRKLLVTSLYRSIKQLSAVLLKAYQVYEPYPNSVWLEVHSLYRYAESNRLHKTRIAEEQVPEKNSSTIAGAYKQILLLALACPYRLRHSEAEDIYQALEEWAHYADLQAVGQSTDALFATDLDCDQPPSYLVLRDVRENRHTSRILTTRKLAEQLRKELREKRDKDPGEHCHQVKTNTLRRLMLAWGVMPKRRFSRVKDHSQVVVAMGLSSIHYFVSGEVAFNDTSVAHDCHSELGTDSRATPLLDRAHFGAKTTGEQEGKLPDVWEMDYQLENVPTPSSVEEAVAHAAVGMQIDTSHYTQSWKMVNVSAGGYCLLWDNPETTRAQVGELLGIREEGDPDTFHWRLGVIRWLKYIDKRGLDLGVQMLSPGAVGIAARRDKKGRVRDEDYTRGLLLPEIASLQQQATLLLPSPPFNPGDTAIANCHGRDVRVRLTKLVENTGSFAQFQFTSLGEVSRPTVKKPAKAPKPTDFDDVWELL